MYLNERGNSISQGQTRTDKENRLITPKSPPMSAPTLSRSLRKESGLISSTKLLDSHPPSLSSTSDGGSKSLSSSSSSSWRVSGPNLRIFVNKIAEITRKQFEDEGKQHSDDVCEREVTTNSNKQEIDSQTRVPSLHLPKQLQLPFVLGRSSRDLNWSCHSSRDSFKGRNYRRQGVKRVLYSFFLSFVLLVPRSRRFCVCDCF